MNVKVLWNGDSNYTRRSDRVLLRPKGAKFPVAQWDRRSAPEGTVRVAVETSELARSIVSLLDSAGVIMIDVSEEFGVPIRYVSVGDIDGMRVGAPDKDLSWQARYFDLPCVEVAAPVGAPVGQQITYDSVAAQFGSYLSIPVSVATYNDLAAGDWSQ
jgi:hypothetical protein